MNLYIITLILHHGSGINSSGYRDQKITGSWFNSELEMRRFVHEE